CNGQGPWKDSIQLPQTVLQSECSHQQYAHYRQASAVLPVHGGQSSAPASLVQPAAQVPLSVKSQFLAQPSAVKVECREDSVLVEVQQDMLSNGQMIQPSEITLGGCVPVGQDPSRGVLLFVSELHGCGSTLTVTDSLIYTFTLVYVPEGLGSTPIVRSHGAVINVECHYLRTCSTLNAVMPTWVPYSAAMSAEERLMFSLQLMTDNWELERASNIYFLGDVLNIEASVVVANHQPLRVFVDSCVATLEPDVTSVPRYAFVGNYGCLTDAKVTGSRSQFLPRNVYGTCHAVQPFFPQIYITCVLKATMASKRADPQHKACSYSVWGSADGDDQVCGCCDSSCNVKGRNVAGKTMLRVGDMWLPRSFSLTMSLVGRLVLNAEL
uniref:Zona pellucida sperm-binding protein 3 n=1 Tax=Scleropages formosus TaxID=113540 RepID=A0A8C9TF28_SCLFO